MTSIIKKSFLIYMLILFTTLSGSLIQATDSSVSESDVEFQQIKEQIAQENNITEQPAEEPIEQTVEQKIREKALSIKSESLPKEQEAIETPLGITPALIEIPAIDARAEVIPLGQTADGNMAAPADIHTIGWYEPGSKPGGNGNAVMAGHVDGLTSPGTFYNLKKLETGDQIHITGTDGTKLTFAVVEKQAYPPDDAPLNDIFGADSKQNLNLITCTGIFNDGTGHYEERLVVYTELVEN